jgi:putative cell wall-binding protein
VSAAAFPAGSDRVYVATGVGFPDALAGAAAAASLGSPILLLPESGLPATVVAEILRLGAGEIVILGGTAVITVSVESALAVAGF